MKLLLLIPAFLVLFGLPVWETDFSQAKYNATKEHKLILLNFSGSDWCGPCIRMKKEIFESAPFLEYAGSSLVLVNADFPRLKKNQLDPVRQDQNNALADKYNPNGIFPYTILLDPQGKVLKSWEGLPQVDPSIFVQQLVSGK